MPTTPTIKATGNGNGKNGHAAPAADRLDHRQLLAAMRAFKRGEFDVKLRDDLTGVDGQICEAFNELVVDADVTREELAQLMGRRAMAMSLARALPQLGGEALGRLAGVSVRRIGWECAMAGSPIASPPLICRLPQPTCLNCLKSKP